MTAIVFSLLSLQNYTMHIICETVPVNGYGGDIVLNVNWKKLNLYKNVKSVQGNK